MRECQLVFILSLALVLLGAGNALAVVHQVANGGELATALSSAVDGDIIEIATGTINWPNGQQIAAAITLRGAGGNPEDVVLDLSMTAAALSNATALAGLDGMVKLQDLSLRSFDGEGNMLELPCAAELENCIISDCSAAKLIDGSDSVALLDCEIRDCLVSGLAETSGDLMVQDCRILENISSGNLLEAQDTLSLGESLFEGNESYFLVALESGSMSIDHCTMVGNQVGALIRSGGESGEISDSLFQGNSGASHFFIGGIFPFNVVNMENCTITGNVAADRIFELGVCEMTFTQCDIVGNDFGMHEGNTSLALTTTFRCCDVNLDNWLINTSPVVDNSNCGVATEDRSLGSMKAMYR